LCRCCESRARRTVRNGRPNNLQRTRRDAISIIAPLTGGPD